MTMLRINWSAQRAKTCPKTCPRRSTLGPQWAKASQRDRRKCLTVSASSIFGRSKRGHPECVPSPGSISLIFIYATATRGRRMSCSGRCARRSREVPATMRPTLRASAAGLRDKDTARLHCEDAFMSHAV